MNYELSIRDIKCDEKIKCFKQNSYEISGTKTPSKTLMLSVKIGW